MAVITFNSSRLHRQISTCVTKAASPFTHLGRETEARERKMTCPELHTKPVKVQVGECAWPASGLIRQEHLNQSSCYLWPVLH